MDRPPRRLGAGRPRTGLALLGLTLALAACSDSTTVEGNDGLVSAAVTGPTDVSAVVIDFTAVSEIDVEGGDAFTSPAEGGGLRAVVVLHEPGGVALLLKPLSEGVSPTATLVDVADGNYEPADLEAYRVVVGS